MADDTAPSEVPQPGHPTVNLLETWTPRAKHRDPRWVAIIAILLFAVSNVTWALATWITHDQVTSNTKVIDRLADANSKLDQIIGFINQAQAAGETNQAETSVAIQQIDQLRQLICQSSDAVRLAACGVTPEPTVPETVQPAASVPVSPPTFTNPCPTLPNGKCRK